MHFDDCFVDATGNTISGATSEAVINAIDELIDATVGAGMPDFLLTNREIMRALRSKAYTDAANERFAGIFTFDNFTMPGINGPMQVRGGRWDGIPMIAVDFDSQKNAVLPLTEDSGDGSDSDNTSIYAVVLGDGLFSGLQKTEGGPMFFEIPDNPGPTIAVDWPIAFLAEHDNCISRLRGIKP